MRFIKNLHIDFRVFLPLILFSYLLFPFINIDGLCWDASTEYAKTGIINQNIHQSLINYIKNSSVHPPFKLFVSSMFYSLLGSNVITYHIMGLVIGYFGLLGIYLLGKNLFNKNVGLVASTLLATFPLFVANTLDNYTDFFVTVFLILALYFYSKNKLFLYSIMGSITVLSKDTGLLLPSSILLIELMYIFRKERGMMLELKRVFFISLPILAYLTWYLYLKINKFDVFSDYIFAQTANKGAFITILYNLLTFNFFHQYAKAHMMQLLYLNFIWAYWIIIIIGFIYTVGSAKLQYGKIPPSSKKQKITTITGIFFLFILFSFSSIKFQFLINPDINLTTLNFNWVIWLSIILGILYFINKLNFKYLIYKTKILLPKEEEKNKTIFAMLLFFILYVLTVVTFQVWDTPRYNLPLIPIIVLIASYMLNKFLYKLPLITILLIGILNFVSLFFSIDPLSIVLYGRGAASGQTYYLIDNDIIGNDDLVYNLQYLLAEKKRMRSGLTRICDFAN